MITLIVWLFVAVILLVVLGFILRKIFNDDGVVWFGLFPAIIVLIIALILYAHMGVRKHKIEVFNQLYQTEYTAEQAFWAGGLIQRTYEEILIGTKTQSEIEAEINLRLLEE